MTFILYFLQYPNLLGWETGRLNNWISLFLPFLSPTSMISCYQKKVPSQKQSIGIGLLRPLHYNSKFPLHCQQALATGPQNSGAPKLPPFPFPVRGGQVCVCMFYLKWKRCGKYSEQIAQSDEIKVEGYCLKSLIEPDPCFHKNTVVFFLWTLLALITFECSFYWFYLCLLLRTTTSRKWLSCPGAEIAPAVFKETKEKQSRCCFTLAWLARSYVSLRTASEAMKSFREGLGRLLRIENSVAGLAVSYACTSWGIVMLN